MELRGVFLPLPTPFTDDGSTISEIRFSRVIRHFSQKPEIEGFVVSAQAGEFSVCSIQERKILTEFAVRDAKGMPVLVNVTSVGSSAMLDLAQHAARHGARMAICAPPIYGDITDEEISAFWSLMANYAGIPIIAVDPSNRLTPEIKSHIERFPQLKLASPLQNGMFSQPTTDEFQFEGLKVSPLAAVHPSLVGKQLTNLSLVQNLGTNRMMKAIMEELDFECGPMRGPTRSLTAEKLAQLKTFLQLAKQATEPSPFAA